MNLKRFFINTILSVTLLLIVMYIFSKPEGTFESSKHFLNVTFKENIQFYKMSELIEKKYGSITAFLPTELPRTDESFSLVSGNRLPAHRQIDGGFIIAAENRSVFALADGVITFVGENEEGEARIEVEMVDGSSVSYSELDSASVRTYQHVQRGDLLGTTGSSDEYFLKTQTSRGLLD